MPRRKIEQAFVQLVISINLVVDICGSVCSIQSGPSPRIAEMSPGSHVGSVSFPVSPAAVIDGNPRAMHPSQGQSDSLS